jgi:hypothetical protein
MFDNNFKPSEEKIEVPYFDDVTSAQGWEGHATGKSIEKLQAEIGTNLALIGCTFAGCQSGTYGDRYGFQIHFAMKSADGRMIPSRLDIACLPINPRKRTRSNRRLINTTAPPRNGRAVIGANEPRLRLIANYNRSEL